MGDAELVSFRKRVGELGRDAKHLLGRQRTPNQALLERFAFDQFHDQEIEAVMVSDVVESADMGMRQLRDRPGFTLEALLEIRVRR